MNKKGFTLIEFLIYIALISVILVALTTFSLRLAKARAKTQVIGEVEYAARQIQSYINDAMRHAEGINTGTSTFNADPGTLSLNMVSVGIDPTVFSLDTDDGVFQISEAGGGAVSITTDAVSITNLVFEDLTSSEDVGIIHVEFTVQANNNTGGPTFDYAQSYQSTFRIPLDNN